MEYVKKDYFQFISDGLFAVNIFKHSRYNSTDCRTFQCSYNNGQSLCRIVCIDIERYRFIPAVLFFQI